MPAEFSVAGSPLTNSGTITITLAAQNPNLVFSGPGIGGAAAPTFRSLVAADIPSLAESKITGLTADLALLAPLASPTFTGAPLSTTPAGADNSTKIATTAYVKGQGYSTTVGTVTSAGLTMPAQFSVASSPITTSGTIAVTLANQNANLVFAGPASGSAAAPTFRSVVDNDLPLPFAWRSRVIWFDDFLRSQSLTTVGELNWLTASTGAGSTNSEGTAVSNRPGLTGLATGTTTTGQQTMYLNLAGMFFSGGVVTNEFAASVNTLSTSSEEFIVKLGFGDSVTGAAPVDGAYFLYDRLGTGTNWQAVTSAASTRTTANTGLTAAAGTFVDFKIVVDAAAGNVFFYTNSVIAVTNSTNIPKTSGAAFGPLMSIVKSAGTTSRAVTLDWWYMRQDFTTPR